MESFDVRIVFLIKLLLSPLAYAETCRVLIDGTGCSTRQQAIERIFEKLPEVEGVTILPRRDAPKNNQRYFVIETAGEAPSKERLVEALGRRAKFYIILSVEPLPHE